MKHHADSHTMSALYLNDAAANIERALLAAKGSLDGMTKNHLPHHHEEIISRVREHVAHLEELKKQVEATRNITARILTESADRFTV